MFIQGSGILQATERILGEAVQRVVSSRRGGGRVVRQIHRPLVQHYDAMCTNMSNFKKTDHDEGTSCCSD
jgi:molybdenum-dependent DNA-binding transcriptional regulator ModE